MLEGYVQKPLSAYTGDEPYIFVSYSHDDDAAVFDEIRWLQDQGINVWYDEGINPGSRWSDQLAQSLADCSFFLYFCTPQSVKSRHCQNEVNLALDEDKPTLAVHLQVTELTRGLQLQLSSHQAILSYGLDEEAYRAKILNAFSGYLSMNRASAGKEPANNKSNLPYFRYGVGILTIIAIGLLLLFRSGTELLQTADHSITTGIPRVAVLPFENQSEDPQQRYFSEGLSEDIATALSRFRVLSVIPPSLAAKYDGNGSNAELGVHYLVRGSVRRDSSEVRVSASLVDSRNDSQLWAETYDRELNATNLFDVQAEIAERIAATLAAASGVVVNIGLQEVRRRPTNSLLAYDCVLRGHAYIAIHSDETHRVARECLEEAIKIDPNYADALGHLAFLYGEELVHQRNVRPNSLDRALEMAQRALELDSRNTTALMAIGMTHQLRRDLATARIYMERALAINPNDTTLLGQLAWIEILTDDIEKGFEFADRVLELNPTPPKWIYNAIATGHYLRSEYEMALLALSNGVPPRNSQVEVLRAASLGMLGRLDEAHRVLDELKKWDPDGVQHELRSFVNIEPMISAIADGLARAGLQIELPLQREGNPEYD